MNPFIYGKVVEGDKFFDRKKECDYLLKTLSGGNNVVLYAPRRFGKTSLALKVIRELEKKGHTCVYFDFMPVYSPESFVRLYSKALSQKQSNLKKFAVKFAAIIKDIKPIIGFNAEGKAEFSVDFTSPKIDEISISALLDISEELSEGKKKTIVFFDEFQEAQELKFFNFEKLLRSKIQMQKKTNYLFFGSKTHLLKDMFNDKKKAFYNATSQMTIGALPQDETVAYLQKKLGAQKLSKELAQYIIVQAGKIPHYIQFLASEIWQYGVGTKKSVTKQIVDICVDNIVALKSDYYMELYGKQSNAKKQLLGALVSKGYPIFSSQYLQEFRLGSSSAVQKSARELINDGIIEKHNNEYFIADPFFKLFILKQNNYIS